MKTELLPQVTEAIREAVVAALDKPLLLSHDDAARLLGLSRSAWFRLHGTPGFPSAVAVPGSGPRWRRADLEKWAAKLGTRRGKRSRTGVSE